MTTQAEINSAIRTIVSYIRWRRRPSLDTGAGDADFVPFSGGSDGRYKDAYLNWLFGYRDTMRRVLSGWPSAGLQRTLVAYRTNRMFKGADRGAEKAILVWDRIGGDVRQVLVGDGRVEGEVESRLDEHIRSEIRARLLQGHHWRSERQLDQWIREHGGTTRSDGYVPWWIPLPVTSG